MGIRKGYMLFSKEEFINLLIWDLLGQSQSLPNTQSMKRVETTAMPCATCVVSLD